MKGRSLKTLAAGSAALRRTPIAMLPMTIEGIVVGDRARITDRLLELRVAEGDRYVDESQRQSERSEMLQNDPRRSPSGDSARFDKS